MTMDTIDAAAPERHAFQAETARLLHLLAHSVYSSRDVFLRELVSNGADACEKLRFRAIAEPALLGDDAQLEIRIEVDKEAGTLAVVDNGIGMSREELVENLGTIARSGTRAFLDEVGEADESRLIGQFGVGFYSVFMVSRHVEVTSRKAGSDEAWRWSSDGSGSFAISPAALDDAPARGTRVFLKLSEDAAAFSDPAEIERIVTEHSSHVPVPIVLIAKGQEPKRLAEGTALWTRPKAEVSAEDYKHFYRHVAHGFDEPALTIHYRAEGRHEYTVLLFVPGAPPFDLYDPERKGHVKLYVRRVFITDEAKLLPPWLRFLRGVVDSQDLPLNLSREMLQASPILAAMRKAITGRVLSELAKAAEADPETYNRVWSAFGPVLKEGLYEDPERRDELLKIARFRTTASGEGWRSLADYVAALKPNQTRIYYALGDHLDQVRASPLLEGFRARGVEVLLLTDPVDAFWIRSSIGFDGKPFQSISQGVADLDAIPLEGEAPAEEPRGAEVASLVAFLKQTLGEAVADVRASSRLAESPACLVAGEFGPDKQLEKLLARAGAAAGFSARILEINPRHSLVRAMIAALPGDKERLADAAHLLLAEARILDGDPPPDPAAFGRRLERLMAQALEK